MNYTKDGIATRTHNIIPLKEQLNTLTTGFMMTAYGFLWLSQELPSFTTKDSVLMPFSVRSSDHREPTNRTWTSTTTTYSKTLACKSAVTWETISGINYSNSNGCVASAGFDIGPEITARYIGYYASDFTDYALSEMGCSSKKFSHTFLAYWAHNPSNQSAAVFCEPAYWAMKVNATVLAENQTVTDIVPLDAPVPLSDNIFNASNFELIISRGTPTKSRRADIPDIQTFTDQTGRLTQLCFPEDATEHNMVGFAVGAARHKLLDYTNAQVLAASFQAAHQLLFALAMNDLLSTTNEPADSLEGIVGGSLSPIAVVRTSALAVEIILGLVTILTFLLLYVSWSRPSQLLRDPASLQDLLSMMRSRSMASDLHQVQSVTEKPDFVKIIEGKFQLEDAVSADETSTNGKIKRVIAGLSQDHCLVLVLISKRCDPRRCASPLAPCSLASSYSPSSL